MDPNSNSFDMSFPKIEIDSENESSSYKRDSRFNWNSENTMKLIDIMETECKELWDVKHPLNKDRLARQAKVEYLANTFSTTTEEISRKIHNLRTQFNNELRKIKRRSGSEGTVVAGSSGWEYFDALTFLLRAPPDPLDTVDSVNLALAEFQADEEMKFGLISDPNANTGNCSSPRKMKQGRVAASAPPPLPPSANIKMWPDQPLTCQRPTVDVDDCKIFGDFVASELRSLRYNESRRKLKRLIQKTILQVSEAEDVNLLNI